MGKFSIFPLLWTLLCLEIVSKVPCSLTERFHNNFIENKHRKAFVENIFSELSHFLMKASFFFFFLGGGRLIYSLYQACEAGEGIIRHRGIRFVCLSVVCRLSVVCLSVCLSVCHQTPHSLWDRSLPKFKMKIFIFWRIDLKFCT